MRYKKLVATVRQPFKNKLEKILEMARIIFLIHKNDSKLN
jgi:hypothetical protein